MIGALVAIQLGMTAIGYIPGAWASDHVRLKPIIVAVWWLTVPTALCFALAPSWPWLIPGYLLTGLYMANNPAFKVYIMLKSEPARVARNISYVFASFPLGMALGPLAGGWLAARYGMRLVFVVAIGFYVASSIVISLIKDTPYHAAGRPWKLADLLANRVFRRNLIFFFGGFFTVYLAQPFVQPYLVAGPPSRLHRARRPGRHRRPGRQRDHLRRRPRHRRPRPSPGHRPGDRLPLLGAVLLLVGSGPPVWALAVFFYGAFDSFRFVTAGIVSRSFGSVPPVWGYAVFDASMGLPMAVGALLGGALYREAYGLPFVVVIGLGVVMLAVLAFAGRGRPAPATGARSAPAKAGASAPSPPSALPSPPSALPSPPSALPSPPSATLRGTKETT